MFGKKYTVTLLNSKWEVVKRNLPFEVIPRKDEFIWFEEQYFEVVNVVHQIDKQQSIFVIVNQLTNKPLIKNFKIEKNE